MLIPLHSIPDIERSCRARSVDFRVSLVGKAISTVVLSDKDGNLYRGQGIDLTAAFKEAFAECDRQRELRAAVSR